MTEHMLIFGSFFLDFGWNRSDCDETFKQDMYTLCDNKYGRKKRWISFLATKIKRCKFLADLYYRSVRIFGRFYWSNPSENWCKSCVKVSWGSSQASQTLKTSHT